MELRLKRNQKLLLPNLLEAKGFYRRLVGLIGRGVLPNGEGLMFRRCNSIHTIGMGFAIDCLFLDNSFHIQKIRHNVKPGRMVFPVLKAQIVIEMNAGLAEKLQLENGDELYVVN